MALKDGSRSLMRGSLTYQVLEAIKTKPGGRTVADLVRITGLDQQTVSKTVNNLERVKHICSSVQKPKLYGVPGTVFAVRTQKQIDAQGTSIAARVRNAIRRNGPSKTREIADAAGLTRNQASVGVAWCFRDGSVILAYTDGQERVWSLPELQGAARSMASTERSKDPLKIAVAQAREWREIKPTTKVEDRVVDGVRVKVPVTKAPCGYDFRFTTSKPEPFFSAGKHVRTDGWAGAYIDAKNAA